MPLGRHLHRWALVVADPADLARTSRGERAALRRVQHAGQVALEHDLPLGDLWIRDRDRRQQGLGVGVVGRVEDLRGGAALHDLAEVHHHDAVREVAHDAQVVADEEERGLVLALDVHQQLGDRGRDRDVERRHRLVRDHHRGIPREGAGNPDALLLTPGELTRAPKVEVPRQLDGVEERQHPLADLRLVRLDPELLDHPGDLRADAVAGVQRVERVLEHHLQGADLLR